MDDTTLKHDAVSRRTASLGLASGRGAREDGRGLLALVAGVVLGGLACVSPLSLDGAPCPCPDGYCCRPDTRTCVAGGSCRAADGPGGDGGLGPGGDAGLGPGGDAAAGDGTTDGGDAGWRAGPTGGGGSDAGTDLSPGAQYCASRAACSDVPALASLAGTCTVMGEQGEFWACECHAGFSLNPETGLCRPGTACEASGADVWSYANSLDNFDCGLRAIQSCAAGPSTPAAQVTSSLLKQVTDACGGMHYGLMVRIELRDGCPFAVEAKRPRSALDPGDLPFLQCLEPLLGKARLDCADLQSCALLEWQAPGPIP